MSKYWLLQREITWFHPAERRRLKDQYDREWELFPGRVGRHLRWTKTARGVSEIKDTDGRLLAKVEGVRLFPPGPLLPRPPRRITIAGREYNVGGRAFGVRVTSPDGKTILSSEGTKNSDRQARTVFHLAKGQSLRFPVSGTSNLNAVMMAVDTVNENPVFAVRQVGHRGHGARAVEVVLEPDYQESTQVLLAVATSYYNLDSYFDRGGG